MELRIPNRYNPTVTQLQPRKISPSMGVVPHGAIMKPRIRREELLRISTAAALSAWWFGTCFTFSLGGSSHES